MESKPTLYVILSMRSMFVGVVILAANAKRTANDESEGSSAKKSRSGASTIDGFSVRWEWEGDKGVWMQYAEEMNNELIDAFVGGKKQMDFDVGPKVTMQIIFDKMVQKNKRTGWERRLRCALADKKDFYIWQWEDENGKWNPYDVKTSIALEKADESDTVDFEAYHRSYSIDVKKKEQINTVTKVKRKVDRVKSASESPEPTDVKPVPSASSSNGTTKKGKGSGVKVKEEPEDEEEEEVKPKASGKGKKGSAKSGGKKGKSGGAKGDDEGTEEIVKTRVVTGKAPVDEECTTMLNKAHIFSEGQDIWDCMLNQTNVGNNNNKYYIIQLLEENAKKSYHVWQRWGRVGYSGQNNLVPCGPDLDQAKKIFTKKFQDKTKNDWYSRASFTKYAGKYDLLEIDYGAKGDEVDAKIKKEDSDIKLPDSKLDKRLQDLINLICDVKLMEDTVREMKYDSKKAPLGKLTADQIKAGYAALKKIETCINNGKFGPALTEACNEFYTRIPHDFGMRTPPLIRDKETVEMKMQLLEALGDIEIAIKTMKMGDKSENPVDRHYHALECDLEPIGKSDDDFKLVNEYLQSTHASTHNQYKMQLEELFQVCKDEEVKKFNDVGNRQLLWHGSRLTNWVGILNKGLRIAPPEAPVTGYMFGKGVYFADMSSKSANYCFTTRAKNTGLILLCEVALGTTNDLLAADYKADKLPSGKHSVRGLGAIAPDPTTTKTLPDGMKVPIGKGKNTGVKNPSGYTLNYNEYIVYDTKQIKMKYLLRVKFNYK
ncbi:hypothetical protein FSP39_008277 [Pinctada imbricata]|uniref:Poly [ADP-ribose] polymerase n=1 Tax=Pinctada imbricata TaxID=66713 RepID=A0AA88XYP7_PINIB|nr:hypothetical protein FSP39_008277 [Pinctada imbricata]